MPRNGKKATRHELVGSGGKTIQPVKKGQVIHCPQKSWRKKLPVTGTQLNEVSATLGRLNPEKKEGEGGTWTPTRPDRGQTPGKCSERKAWPGASLGGGGGGGGGWGGGGVGGGGGGRGLSMYPSWGSKPALDTIERTPSSTPDTRLSLEIHTSESTSSCQQELLEETNHKTNSAAGKKALSIF